jgi:hypothetical protein
MGNACAGAGTPPARKASAAAQYPVWMETGDDFDGFRTVGIILGVYIGTVKLFSCAPAVE